MVAQRAFIVIQCDNEVDESTKMALQKAYLTQQSNILVNVCHNVLIHCSKVVNENRKVRGYSFRICKFLQIKYTNFSPHFKSLLWNTIENIRKYIKNCYSLLLVALKNASLIANEKCASSLILSGCHCTNSSQGLLAGSFHSIASTILLSA